MEKNSKFISGGWECYLPKKVIFTLCSKVFFQTHWRDEKIYPMRLQLANTHTLQVDYIYESCDNNISRIATNVCLKKILLLGKFILANVLTLICMGSKGYLFSMGRGGGGAKGPPHKKTLGYANLQANFAFLVAKWWGKNNNMSH